jgi:SnoaL-like polyketide cyclase
MSQNSSADPNGLAKSIDILTNLTQDQISIQHVSAQALTQLSKNLDQLTKVSVEQTDLEKVAGYGIWRGIHQGVFLGIPPTGKWVTVSSMVFDYYVDGKLKECRLLMNVMSLMQQLGVVSTPE